MKFNHQTEEKSNSNNINNSKPNIAKPLIIAGSLITIGAIALLVPLLININKYYSFRTNPEPAPVTPAPANIAPATPTPTNTAPTNPETTIADLDFAINVNKLEQFCNRIDSDNSSNALTLISKLERNQQLLEGFPDSCQLTLDELIVSVTPKLGHESRVLEAVQHLCKIPEDSPMFLEAEVWLQHWYDSPDWGDKIKLYLGKVKQHQNFDCPAGYFTKEMS